MNFELITENQKISFFEKHFDTGSNIYNLLGSLHKVAEQTEKGQGIQQISKNFKNNK